MAKYPSLVAAALLAAFSCPAFGQQPAACGDRSAILKHLSVEHGEARVAFGVLDTGGVLEILSGRSGASWTIIITLPNGPTCLVAAGEAWENVPAIRGEKT